MRGLTRYVVYGLPAVLLISNVGCSRNFFRQAADKDVEGVITEKNQFPDWDVKSWSVYPDPRSRYADPNNPDRPPYPPDDYAARILSPNPQHPTYRTGVGRVEPDGYLKMLEEWNTQNRAADQARGVPPESLGSCPPVSWMILPKEQPATGSQAAATPPDVGPWVRTQLPPPPLPVPKHEEAKSGEPNPEPPSVSETREVVKAAAEVAPALSSSAVSSTTPPGIDGKPATLPSIPDPQASATVPLLPVGAAVPATPPAPETLPSATPVGPAANEVALQPTPLPKMTPSPNAGQPPPVFPGAKFETGAGEFPRIENLITTGTQAEDYIRALSTNQRGFRIKMDQAVELGLINAREMQDQREALYLAALPVTLDRFNLAAQGFFTQQLLATSLGKISPLSPLSIGGSYVTSPVSLNSSLPQGISKLFPTGAELMIQAANQVVINFGQGQPTVGLSNLSLSVMQPFLAGGGFAVNLEQLTLDERTLLYAMRSYTRFRKIIYVSITTGGGLTNNPYGLPGLSENLGRGIGENLTAPTIGFLPILQSGAIVINNKKNVETLERYLRQYQAYREGGQLSDLQVGLVEVQMLNTRATLLGSTGTTGASGSIRGYLDAIDNFKLQLAIPETVALDLDIGPLKPIHRQLTKYEKIYADVREAEDLAHAFNPNEPVNQFRPRWGKLLTQSNLVKGTNFSKNIFQRWASWERLTDDQLTGRLGELRKERSDLLDKRADLQLKGQKEPEADTRRISDLEADIDLAFFERTIRAYEKQPWLKKKTVGEQASEKAGAYRDAFNAFYQLVLEARNERLEVAHATWPKLPAEPVFGVDALSSTLDEAYTACVQGALSSRLDLMDARGQVVDAWRQIAVTANALQGVLDVGYNYSASSLNTPAGSTGNQNQLVINAQLPLVRRAQRNAYRTAQINYQSTRRLLMAFEDNIANDVRNDIRQLRALAEDYKIQQRVVEQSYSIMENAAEVLFAPPIPGTVLDPGTAAATTLQLLQAVSGLLTAQNTLYIYWVGFLTNRIQMYLDLELMQLDERGIWKDESFPALEENDTPAAPGQPERLPAPIPVGVVPPPVPGQPVSRK